MLDSIVNPVTLEYDDIMLSRPLPVVEYFDSRICERVLTFYDPIDGVLSMDILAKVKSFEKLEDNWDNYGAMPPSELALNNCISFFKYLPNKYFRNLNKDDISLTPYGTIILDWSEEGKNISIEIGDNSVGFFSEFDNEKISSEGINFNKDEISTELGKVFRRFYN